MALLYDISVHRCIGTLDAALGDGLLRPPGQHAVGALIDAVLAQPLEGCDFRAAADHPVAGREQSWQQDILSSAIK